MIDDEANNCVISSLFEIFKWLSSNTNHLTDDTHADKLISLCVNLVQTTDDASKLVSTSVKDFLMAAAAGRLGADRLVIALRLAPHLALFLDEFLTEEDGLLWKLWRAAQTVPFWQEGSVRDAWVSSMHLLATNGRLDTSILHSHNGVARVVELLADRSMFVRRQAEALVTHWLCVTAQHDLHVIQPLTQYITGSVYGDSPASDRIAALTILSRVQNEVKGVEQVSRSFPNLHSRVVELLLADVSESERLPLVPPCARILASQLKQAPSSDRSDVEHMHIVIDGLILELIRRNCCQSYKQLSFHIVEAVDFAGAKNISYREFIDYIFWHLDVKWENGSMCGDVHTKSSGVKCWRVALGFIRRLPQECLSPRHKAVLCDVLEDTAGLPSCLLRDVLLTLAAVTCAGDDVTTLASRSLAVMTAPGAPPLVVTAACDCVQRCVHHAQLEQLQLHQLRHTLERCLVHTHWEVRDSAVQLAMTLSARLGAHDPCVSALLDLVWTAINDENSYVRAAVCGAVTSMTRGASDVMTYVETVSALVETDTEAVVRRAALTALCEWADSERHQAAGLDVVRISRCISDLDWEVKLAVLKCWQARLGPVLALGDSRAVRAALESNRFCEEGCFYSLLVGISDHDPSVQHKACSLTVDMLQRLATDSQNGDTADPAHRPPATQAFLAHNGSDTSTSDGVELSDVCREVARAAGVGGVTLAQLEAACHRVDVVGLCAAAGRSTDEYARHPAMLLQDVLATLTAGGAGEASSVDCY